VPRSKPSNAKPDSNSSTKLRTEEARTNWTRISRRWRQVKQLIHRHPIDERETAALEIMRQATVLAREILAQRQQQRAMQQSDLFE